MHSVMIMTISLLLFHYREDSQLMGKVYRA
jgi:hypothetical protein